MLNDLLSNLDSIVSGYKTYTASAVYIALVAFLESKGINVTAYQSLLEQAYALLVEVLSQLGVWFAAVVVILRKARSVNDA